jgi:hypothetical protein
VISTLADHEKGALPAPFGAAALSAVEYCYPAIYELKNYH